MHETEPAEKHYVAIVLISFPSDTGSGILCITRQESNARKNLQLWPGKERVE